MKTLIFDFDGTIADSFETLLEVFEEITARPQKLTAQEVKDLRGKSSALRKIIKKGGLKAADCIYIGDEARDVEAAGKASVTSIGVTWGFNNEAAIKSAKPSAIANSPKDLLRIIN